MTTFQFYRTCVNWPSDDVDEEGGLCDMISTCRKITRRTFLKHANRIDLAGLCRDLGYENHHNRGLTMAKDWHVQYRRGSLHGHRVYFFVHSAIEYVFKKEGSQS